MRNQNSGMQKLHSYTLEILYQVDQYLISNIISSSNKILRSSPDQNLFSNSIQPVDVEFSFYPNSYNHLGEREYTDVPMRTRFSFEKHVKKHGIRTDNADLFAM